MDTVSETGPPLNEKGARRDANLTAMDETTYEVSMPSAVAQVKPYSYQAEALRQLAAFTPFQEWKRLRRLQLKGAKP